MKLKCIAIDDEPLALDLVCSYIEQTPFLELSARYTNGIEALKEILESPADLLFLDIQMSGLTGVELARVIAASKSKISVIFTTAYDQFALEGYKVNAIDYLLKPFSYEEFLRAASKAKTMLLPVEGHVADAENEKNLFLKVEHQLVRVPHDEIKHIEGLKDYVKVHLTNGKTILSLTSLKKLETLLPHKQFMRVHRSFIVSLNRIDSLTKNSVQIDNQYITVTDNYRNQFDEFVKKWRN